MEVLRFLLYEAVMGFDSLRGFPLALPLAINEGQLKMIIPTSRANCGDPSIRLVSPNASRYVSAMTIFKRS